MENDFIKGIKTVERPNKKISEIQPIKEFGRNFIKEKNASEIIDEMVEEPLRKACKELKNKGIETVMSSANKTNLLKKGEKAIEREDVEGQEFFLDMPTYESAGRGYAWIMINFDNLTDENKKILFSLQQAKNSQGNNIGERIIWFVKGRNIMDMFNQGKSDETKNNLDEQFEKHAFVLKYNVDRYPNKVVFLRMPINDETTVIDVERYFEKLTGQLKQQEVEISSTRRIEKEMDI